MPTAKEAVRFAICQLGQLPCSAEVRNAIDLANQTQDAFLFSFQEKRFPLAEQYRLPNGGYDLDAAIAAITRRHQLPRPLLFITAQAYSNIDYQDDPKGFFFFDQCAGKDAWAVSTHLWQKLAGSRALQPYVLHTLATIAFNLCAHLSMHNETRGCPFDYCDNPCDIDKSLPLASLCPECSGHLDRALREGRSTLEQAAAAQRLLNRAAGRRQAFVAMPFPSPLDAVFRTIQSLLNEPEWRVVRADDQHHPRSITAAIIFAILASDLFIAELTGSNPNVFYELGWAHATHRDVLLLTQEEKIPFDVTTERAIKYTPDDAGMACLVRQLSRATEISHS